MHGTFVYWEGSTGLEPTAGLYRTNGNLASCNKVSKARIKSVDPDSDEVRARGLRMTPCDIKSYKAGGGLLIKQQIEGQTGQA